MMRWLDSAHREKTFSEPGETSNVCLVCLLHRRSAEMDDGPSETQAEKARLLTDMLMSTSQWR